MGILAPASRVDIAILEPAFQTLRNWGLEVVLGETLTRQFHQFAGTDAERAADVQQFLDDVSIRAIFAARGGYGSSRLIERLDFSIVRQNPNWLIGFSDITALHGHLNRLGVESIHAAMPKTFGLDETGLSVETLRRALFGETLDYQLSTNSLNRFGTGVGAVVGGNLCVFNHLLGSASEVETRGKILFLEDIDEYLHATDRYFVQLKRAGKLAHLAGLLAGSFSDVKDNPDAPFGFTPYELIAEHVAGYDYPVVYGFPVGHEAANRALICGRRAELSVTSSGVRLTFEA